MRRSDNPPERRKAATPAIRRDVPALPAPRGPFTDALVTALRHEPGGLTSGPSLLGVDVLGDDDVQLALTCCYELHYAGFAGVDDRWEWEPSLLAYRQRIEHALLHRLEDEVRLPPTVSAGDAIDELRTLAHGNAGPSLSRFMHREGTLPQMREFCVHRAEYQRKEADPHTWMIPRLTGRAKAAAVSIQYDEYGAGDPAAMHAELFADTMTSLGLDATYGAYRELLPAATLATGNLVSMFGLHRELRGACVGHLALFEMTSVGPMHRYAQALRRLGTGEAGARFYEVHVEADAWHEQVAQHDLVAGLLDDDPSAAGMVVFGARALAEVERRMSSVLLSAWECGRSSLLAPIPDALAA